MSATTTDSNDQFPALAEMGIIRFHEISHYALSQDSSKTDVLRIKYKRAKGSFLPHSRKYKFGRAQKTVVADGGTAKMEHVYEISPFLLKAVGELDSLVTSKNAGNDTSSVNADDVKMAMLTELTQIDQLISESMSTGDTTTAKAKLDALRQQLESL